MRTGSTQDCGNCGNVSHLGDWWWRVLLWLGPWGQIGGWIAWLFTIGHGTRSRDAVFSWLLSLRACSYPLTSPIVSIFRIYTKSTSGQPLPTWLPHALPEWFSRIHSIHHSPFYTATSNHLKNNINKSDQKAWNPWPPHKVMQEGRDDGLSFFYARFFSMICQMSKNKYISFLPVKYWNVFKELKYRF